MRDDFDICGTLPSGTTVLEASAGTGKTFTIAALATRYVAEGRAELHELMLVTFGRMATQELRERVRERLVSAEHGLADPVHARGDSHDDDLLRLLAGGTDANVIQRRGRLRRALADFDAATLTTTHGFCLQMLRGLGVAGDYEPDATFVDSVDDVIEEVARDLWLRKFGRPGSPEPPLRYSEALSTVRQAVQDSQAQLTPSDADPGTSADQRFRMACAARKEVARRMRQRRLIGFDDLLSRLQAALSDSETGEAARQRVRSRYRVVLVDEFQDTDPVQWDILCKAFHQHTTLILIGDPKQAIYAFRGGDVVAYLAATEAATTRATLGRNWRSDDLLLSGLQQIFRGASLGDPRITVHPVDAAHHGRRLAGAQVDTPIRLRVVTRPHTGTDPDRSPAVAPTREVVAADLAGDVVRLLSGGARLDLDRASRADQEHRDARLHGEPVAPRHLAVLVHTNSQAALVRESLVKVGVPAVIAGAANVFSTEIARDWLILLQALEQPRGARVRTAALTCFLGWSAGTLAEAGEEALDRLGPRLRVWADVLTRRGVPGLLEQMTEEGELTARMLSADTGERRLTDLRHIAQALHVAAVEGQLGTAALVEWLQHRILDAATDPSEERVRRLESDAEAVQVVTYHRSKGLEFPIVYVPFGWDSHKYDAPELLRLHRDGTRTIDIGGPSGPHYRDNLHVHRQEDAGEDLRMLYVALTRARCQVVAWWAPTGRNTHFAPLHRLLFGDQAPGAEPEQRVPVPTDEQARDRLAGLAAGSGGAIVAEPADPAPGLVWQPPAGGPPQLSAARFSRSLDTSWRRLSYTALTAGVHEQQVAAAAAAGVTAEPEERRLDDEAVPAGSSEDQTSRGGSGASAGAAAESELRAVASPMADLPSGAAFGIVVHELLEHADTTAPDLASELTERARVVLSQRRGGALDPEVLGPALLPSMLTPLGPLAGGVRLADIRPGDRLSELAFELPLAGGDRPAAGEATLTAMAETLRRHLGPDDPFAPYPDLLEALPPQRLRGYLTGSLDAVLRLSGTPVSSGAAAPRYVVADYKTNWLGDAWPGAGEPLTAWHYRPHALADAMLAAHYPLQALLYLVALHRYLGWRQPDYDPAVSLGGVLYLFVRGMCGPDTPVVDGSPCGVFGWQPPPGLVEELSRLLAGGVT
ncbi:MAG: exodeoxyribonuclease beta subunit [Nocardioidaceae bacterium]|nr:exodeoxyribonuclease beta subunit [Nocardioidaceae bacterium]